MKTNKTMDTQIDDYWTGRQRAVQEAKSDNSVLRPLSNYGTFWLHNVDDDAFLFVYIISA